MSLRRQLRIIVVEDNPADFFLIREALRSNDIECEITRFDDGERALHSVANYESLSPPDLFLLDLNLPRVQGIEILKAIRKSDELKNVPVAILTSSQSASDMQEAADAGASAYVRKQPLLDDFLESIGHAVRELVSADGH
jgi:CheY-like chemotaxis protein